jgi:hypothetical protein
MITTELEVEIAERQMALHRKKAQRHRGTPREQRHYAAMEKYAADICAFRGIDPTEGTPQQTKRATRAAERAFKDRGIEHE